MIFETNPNHEEFANWMLLHGPKEIIQARLGDEEYVQHIAEIDEEDKKVFLKECEHCELPKITHSNIDCTSCDIIECVLTTQEKERIKDVVKTLTATQEGKEELNVAPPETSPGDKSNEALVGKFSHEHADQSSVMSPPPHHIATITQNETQSQAAEHEHRAEDGRIPAHHHLRHGLDSQRDARGASREVERC